MGAFKCHFYAEHSFSITNEMTLNMSMQYTCSMWQEISAHMAFRCAYVAELKDPCGCMQVKQLLQVTAEPLTQDKAWRRRLDIADAGRVAV